MTAADESLTDQGTFGPVDVLLVEDDPGDVLITREAFEQHGIRSRLHVVSDGEQAIEFLRRVGDFTTAPKPGLILLDLNLPRRNGLEVLAEVKADSELLPIPVVVLTTSHAQEDILRSYSLHANAYITKPMDFDHFINAIRQIDNFFLTLVKLPAPDLEAIWSWPCLSYTVSVAGGSHDGAAPAIPRTRSAAPAGWTMASATRFMKARVVAVATRRKIARSRPVPKAPSGGRYAPASVSKVACSPAGASVMSASRAGNSPPPSPEVSHLSVSTAEPPRVTRSRK